MKESRDFQPKDLVSSVVPVKLYQADSIFDLICTNRRVD